MRQVSKEEFYGPIWKDRLNVHPSIVNDRYPYTSEWRYLNDPMRRIYGRVVGRMEGGLSVKDYYLTTPNQ